MDTGCYIVIDFRRMLGIGTVEKFRETGEYRNETVLPSRSRKPASLPQR